MSGGRFVMTINLTTDAAYEVEVAIDRHIQRLQAAASAYPSTSELGEWHAAIIDELDRLRDRMMHRLQPPGDVPL